MKQERWVDVPNFKEFEFVEKSVCEKIEKENVGMKENDLAKHRRHYWQQLATFRGGSRKNCRGGASTGGGEIDHEVLLVWVWAAEWCGDDDVGFSLTPVR